MERGRACRPAGVIISEENIQDDKKKTNVAAEINVLVFIAALPYIKPHQKKKHTFVHIYYIPNKIIIKRLKWKFIGCNKGLQLKEHGWAKDADITNGIPATTGD
jgi:hypothetical protein